MASTKKRRRRAGWRYTALYRDPAGRQRSAGTFRTKAEADRAGIAAEMRMGQGTWVDAKAGRITFTDYVEIRWFPSRHLEVSTKAAYRSYLDRHFLPAFGPYPMAEISPHLVQTWVRTALEGGLSARSVAKYHTMLHSIFKRAVADRVIGYNPCESTDLPKIVIKRRRILSPSEFELLLAAIPQPHRAMVLTGIETGMRWGELAALRPVHLDGPRQLIRVEETIVEVSKKNSPSGRRYLVKPYPKDDEPRSLRISSGLVALLLGRIRELEIGEQELLFPSTQRNLRQPMSRNTWRTRIWRPAIARSAIDPGIRMHDLRHAHASWLLAGGADLKTVMDRLGHTQIQTTQRYLHALPDADDRALDAFQRIRGGESQQQDPSGTGDGGADQENG